MTYTSLTIGAVEYITKVNQQSFVINDETGGRIGTCEFVLTDTHAAIAGLSKAEVIAYTGATKRFGGYIGTVEQRRVNSLQSQATVVCRDYNSLLDSVTVPSETYTAQTDEAILDDLFSTYLPVVSTTPVVQVKASVTVTFTNKTLRQCVETLADLTNAEWYIDANEALQYYDSAAATANKIPLMESPGVVFDTSNFSGWRVSQCAYADNELNEVTSGDTSHWIDTNGNRTFEDGEDYVLWFDVKEKERSWVNLYTNAIGGGKSTYFDIGNGAVGYTPAGITASIAEIGDGVYRCMVAFTADTTAGYVTLYMAEANLDSSYVGVAGSGIYLYGAYCAKGVPFQFDPFTHTEDWQALCNSVTVVGATTADSGDPPYICDVDAAEPGSYGVIDDSWPMTDPYVTHSDYTALQIAFEFSSPNYNLQVGLLGFNTAAIPNDATITRAVLRLYPTSAANASHFKLGVEYYAFGGTPSIGDWTQTASNSAYGFLAGDDIAVGTWAELELTSPNANVSKTGYTGFRLHADDTTPSAASCFLQFARSGTTAPQLVVEWTTSDTISETRTDATSISAYGTHKRTIYDESITTGTQAQLRGDVELARYKDPEEFGNITWRRDGIGRGDVVRIVSATYGVDADFHLARVSSKQLPGGVTEYSGQYGRYQPDIVNLIRKLAAAS